MSAEAEAEKQQIDLRKQFKGRDEWFFDVALEIAWPEEIDKEITSGHRNVKIHRENGHGWVALKRDQDGPDGLFEKICADLAQIISAPVPAAVLRRFKDGKAGVVQRVPRGNQGDLQKLQDAARSKADTDGTPFEDPISQFAPFYDPLLMGLDLWVAHGDRQSNLGNLLGCRCGGEIQLHGIDYGYALGGPQGWMESAYRAASCQPLPTFVPADSVNKEKVMEGAARIAGVEDRVIQLLVERAGNYYGSPGVAAIVKPLGDGLIYRKNKVAEWLLEMLA